MYAPSSAPLSIGGVIDDAIRLYRSSFGRSAILAFALSVVLAAFGIVLISSAPNNGVERQSVLQMMAALRSPRMLGAYVLVTLLTLALYGALMALQSAVARGDASFSLGSALATGFRRLPGALLASLICMIALVLGTIALIIPGIWLWGRLQLWMAAMFAEDKDALDALRSSWNLTKRNWWRGTTIFSLGAIMAVVCSVVFQVTGGIVAALARVDAVDVPIVLQLFSGVAYIFIYPFLTAVWLAMYHDFKLRHEGGRPRGAPGSLQ